MAKLRQFEINNYYHAYSRGVDRCDIFRDHSDYLFFEKLINIFNVDKKVRTKKNKNDLFDDSSKLVNIFCYTLMPNHFHFIFEEIKKCGISKFLQKVLGTYSRYYNDKYNRVGSLFGERFKDKLVDSDRYFDYLVGYIWNNPVKLIKINYKSADLLNGLINLSREEKDFAKKYPYKSFPLNYSGPNYADSKQKVFYNFNFE
jgi:putative transposase